MRSSNGFWKEKISIQFSPSTGLHHVVIQAHTEFKDKQYSFHITHNQNSYRLICNISTYLQRERKLLILSRSRKIHYGNQGLRRKKNRRQKLFYHRLFIHCSGNSSCLLNVATRCCSGIGTDQTQDPDRYQQQRLHCWCYGPPLALELELEQVAQWGPVEQRWVAPRSLLH